LEAFLPLRPPDSYRDSHFSLAAANIETFLFFLKELKIFYLNNSLKPSRTALADLPLYDTASNAGYR
jgi:hypothetical protein